jgi:hypothetical protein
MKVMHPHILSTIFATLLAASAASAGTVNGTVVNRTTGKPTPNVDLTLLSPTQGMREIGSAKSDAQGHFTATSDAIGMGPVLIRATYHDVSFNTFLPPGRPQIEVEIYEISRDPKTISVPSHVVIFQPQGDRLIGAEEYSVQNASQPPAAYFRTEGNFDFAIPENGTIGQVTTTTSMGMPVNQATIEKGKGRFAISYPFRPGQTNVRLSYELPYSNNSATFKLPATYAGMKLLVVVPPGITVTGDGLTSAGQEQGMMVFTHDPLVAKSALSISLSGVGSPQSAAAGGQGQEPAQEGNSRTGPEVTAAPSRLDDFKWYLFGGLAALFAMGAILLTRKQVVLAEGPDDESDSAPATPKAAKPAPPAKPKKAPPAPQPAASAAPTNSHSSKAAAAIDEHVSVSMDSLKDKIFRLELRRQAGTISEEDYAREKAQVEKILRDLVKGQAS